MQRFPPRVRAYETPTRPARPRREPGVPSTRSPRAFLWSLMAAQADVLAAAALMGALFYLPGATIPYFLGQAIDRGILAHDRQQLLLWAGAMLAVIVVGVIGQLVQHWLAVSNWLIAMYRVIGLVVRKVTQMGHVIGRRVPTGEMLSVTGSDSDIFGAFAEVLGRCFAALLAFVLVAVLVLDQSLLLGTVVLVAAPLLVLAAVPLLPFLQRTQATERERSSILTGMATDIVGGLRILRGIGGERTFGDNYAAQSQRVRRAGVAAQTWFGAIDSIRVLLSGLLLVVLTWLGTQELLAGRVSTGQLISFFGYAVFLINPMQTFYETALRYTQTVVSANKAVGLLSQQPPWPPAASDVPVSDGPGELVDERSGLVVRPGHLSVLVSAQPDMAAAIADRLGRYLSSEAEAAGINVGDGLTRREARARNQERIARRGQIAARDEAAAAGGWGVRLDGVDLGEIPLHQLRQRLMVSDAATATFSGTLQSLLDPLGVHGREQAEHALAVASAHDVWDALPGGWQGRIDERGRGLSGG
ncbi:MAG: ABC transporter transmembrane domain-containing protein, partial [Brooklawnia sp.]